MAHNFYNTYWCGNSFKSITPKSQKKLSLIVMSYLILSTHMTYVSNIYASEFGGITGIFLYRFLFSVCVLINQRINDFLWYCNLIFHEKMSTSKINSHKTRLDWCNIHNPRYSHMGWLAPLIMHRLSMED